ncbi:shikimate kinase, chloroplastic isoform X1 [Mangifera indica]|uniref:shikimate kinase, chloroplastic isoform X1 n=1 Tax=Mangifera indica TaxID=29780 RepID=UPI001CFC3C40|nr:shikimate kinase, chloroplastic isoform X1 [Mangifera indica]XP_044469828.1 shikimate kinase, chloroplastic isoform X1 [Mangifera indica]
MEAKVLQKLQYPTRVDLDKFQRKPTGSVKFSRRMREAKWVQVFISADMQHGITSNWKRSVALEVPCTFKSFPASILEPGDFYAPLDEALILKNKSQEIEPYLDGRCIYLVGMMGSGKTTVGKALSGMLGYSFFDSDSLIEQAVGGTTVADIFKLYGEGFFRDKETEVLQKLSIMHRLVVSTGGGAVTRTINWEYMHKGVSVFLDVPLEALARRIASVGTNSRPLLHHESGDAYTRAFKRLTTLWEERSTAYNNANARVCLEHIAAKLGHKDVSTLTPAVIAMEVLEQIECFLKDEGEMPF